MGSTFKLESIDFLIVLVLVQFIVYATTFLDLPVIRQLVGFLYFTFVPGFVFTKLLRLDKLDRVETVLFSVGFSIAILMLVGLLTNEVGALFGISRPLSMTPLMLVLNTLVLIMGTIVSLRNGRINRWGEIHRTSWSAIPLLGLPVLAAVGAMVMNATGGNSVLLFMLIVISLLFIVGVAIERLFQQKLYALAVVVIAVSLLYHSSLISKYLVSFGSDVTIEYYVFKNVAGNAFWNSAIPSISGAVFGRLNAMLSVTILPTVYSSLLNIDPALVFKIAFPTVFCLVPLALWKTWEPYVGKRYAFFSVFLFVAQGTFYTEMLGLERQMIGELFFALLFLVILKKKMQSSGKIICFLFFSSALIVSHYALAEIFLFFLTFAILPLIVLKRPNRRITIGMLFLFFVLMFTWYIYTSGSSVFDSFVSFGDQVYRQLGEFSNPASRGETVLLGLGLGESPSIWNSVSRAFAYATEALIAFGFLGLFLKRSGIARAIRSDTEYFVFIVEAMALLVGLITLPGLANTLNMTRFYHILLFFSAPLCIVGAEFLANLVFKKKTRIVTPILLVSLLTPYFFFQTGFVYEITGSESWSLPLSMYRMEGYKLIRQMGTIPAPNVYGAIWVSEFTYLEKARIYADMDSINKALVAYGLIPIGQINILYNTTRIEKDGIVYLGQLNVVYGVVSSGSILWNSSERSYLFASLSKIYSNGGCDIYRNVNAGPEG